MSILFRLIFYKNSYEVTVMKKLFITLLVISFSSQAQVIIDKTGVDEKDYIYDLHQCEELASQVQKDQSSRSVIGTAAKGAVAGGAGAAIGGGSGSSGAKTGAGVGAAVGIIGRSRDKRASQSRYEEEKEQVVKNCMAQRGYIVLN